MKELKEAFLYRDQRDKTRYLILEETSFNIGLSSAIKKKIFVICFSKMTQPQRLQLVYMKRMSVLWTLTIREEMRYWNWRDTLVQGRPCAAFHLCHRLSKWVSQYMRGIESFTLWLTLSGFLFRCKGKALCFSTGTNFWEALEGLKRGIGKKLPVYPDWSYLTDVYFDVRALQRRSVSSATNRDVTLESWH